MVTGRHAWGGAAERRPETSVSFGKRVCVTSLQLLPSECSFGISSFASHIIVHFSLAFFEGLFLQRKTWFKVISKSPHVLLLGYECLFTLTV